MEKPSDLARLQGFFTRGDKENSEVGKMVLMRSHRPFLPPGVFEFSRKKIYFFPCLYNLWTSWIEVFNKFIHMPSLGGKIGGQLRNPQTGPTPTKSSSFFFPYLLFKGGAEKSGITCLTFWPQFILG